MDSIIWLHKEKQRYRMDELQKKIELSIRDLKRIQRRIHALEDISQRSMSWMERAADNCWEYPNADDKFAELEERMLKLEEKQNILSESSDLIIKLLENLSKIQ